MAARNLSVDVRILDTSNRDLEKEVAAAISAATSIFASTWSIWRGLAQVAAQDIPVLARHFVKKYAEPTDAAAADLAEALRLLIAMRPGTCGNSRTPSIGRCCFERAEIEPKPRTTVREQVSGTATVSVRALGWRGTGLIRAGRPTVSDSSGN